MEELFDRRLPVYLLIDCSESMVGDGIEAVQKGMATLMGALRADPHALETVWLSVITFADTATQIIPLTEVTKVILPRLRVRPGTALGAALLTLHSALRREVRLHTPTSRGDWRPIVFLLTDGVPTDEWEKAAKACRSFHSSTPLNIIAIGCGDDVSPYVLKQITNNVLQMKDVTSANLLKAFQWISSSISTVSTRIGSKPEEAMALSELPGGALEFPVIPDRPGEIQKKQLFLVFRCSHTCQPYLMRYRLSNQGYEPIRTHKVDEDYFAGQSKNNASISLSSASLLGTAPCPYCGNEGNAMCFSCNTWFCRAPNQNSVICPGCKKNLTIQDCAFDVSGRKG